MREKASNYYPIVISFWLFAWNIPSSIVETIFGVHSFLDTSFTVVFSNPTLSLYNFWSIHSTMIYYIPFVSKFSQLSNGLLNVKLGQFVLKLLRQIPCYTFYLCTLYFFYIQNGRHGRVLHGNTNTPIIFTGYSANQHHCFIEFSRRQRWPVCQVWVGPRGPPSLRTRGAAGEGIPPARRERWRPTEKKPSGNLRFPTA